MPIQTDVRPNTRDEAAMSAALIRYRVIAWVVGVLLLVLTAIGMPLRYFAGDRSVVAAVGPVHGFLYLGYLALSADLARRARWRLRFTALVLLAGTVPLLSFVAERAVTRRIRGVDVARA